MKEITEMSREEILGLDPGSVCRLLTAAEVVHIATMLGAFWSYDYEAQEAGRAGLHALLKSGRHSDGFFVSKILLEPPNIRRIMAVQMCQCLYDVNVPTPHYVAGIPDGATLLGQEVANVLGVTLVKMEKKDGCISIPSGLTGDKTLLLIEDFCTRGTGFTEAVRAVKSSNPGVTILGYDPVIINRGGLTEVNVEGVGSFMVISVVDRRIQDWDAEECPLCRFGSEAIKPKVTDENWQRLTRSQV